jgi:sortase (surface protein transpeptidase)
MMTPGRRGPGLRPLALASLLAGAAVAVVVSAVVVAGASEPDPVTAADVGTPRAAPPQTSASDRAEPERATEVAVDRTAPSGPATEQDDEGATRAEDPAPGEDPAPAPTGVRIPTLGVDAPMIELELQEDRSLEVPEDAHVTGWWTGGSAPGERGPAVVVGHVDSYEGPGVFLRLAELEPGDEVTIDRQDGTSVTYAVQRAEWHRKDVFPTQAVYGATEAPTLRLITCGGEFDPDARSYEENLVVFLELVGWS